MYAIVSSIHMHGYIYTRWRCVVSIGYCFLALAVFTIGLSAANLRCKVFGCNPDPYMKLVVTPGARLPKLHHHGQLKVLPSCSNTVHPHWNNTVSK